MNELILNKVQYARDLFSIENFPGNFFELICGSVNDIEKYHILIFRKHLGKLDGFISYESNYTYIGVNQVHPIGRQNFTLAHEIGHMLLHNGKSFCDDNVFSSNKYETEASNFASELLYPSKSVENDTRYINENDLFNDKYEELACFINELCHKYVLSFDAVLRRIVYYNDINLSVNGIKSKIKKKLGKSFSNLDTSFYLTQNEEYKKDIEATNLYLINLVEMAVKEHNISVTTGQEILYSNDLLGESNK